MPAREQDSTRILRLAAWIWIGYLLALGLMDLLLYMQARLPLVPNAPIQPPLPPNPLNPSAQNLSFFPVYLYYASNGLVALSFLAFAYWDWIQEQLSHAFYPLLLLTISAAPIIINVLVVPRFPNGPLANAEGMALRQLPVLFLALALVAWQYQLPHVIFFSIATTGLELALISAISIDNRGAIVLFFIAIIRTISFIALGVFISLLVTRLREQQESLRQANANLTHYASTLEQLVVSRERNRMARELHDTLAHTLSGLTVQLETAKAYWDVEPETARHLLTRSLAATRSGLDETRRALKSLRASPLEDLGLLLALQYLSETAAERGRLELELVLPEQIPSLSPDVEQCIYRIAQEALENVVNHAQAEKLSVHLTVQNSELLLVVQDDGWGVNLLQAGQAGHFGLVGMRERAELAGGDLAIQSMPGEGTCVQLVVKGIRT